MAEITEEVCDGDQIVAMEKEEEKEENVTSSMMGDEAFLLELNLVMIIASLTLSNQEVSELEDMEKHNVKDQELKAFVSKCRGRKRDIDELRIPDRRTTRIQPPRILDSRHGRKM
ncbi:uncharacterized protein LOC141596627 [Silene latifolia]|uniref:uncharacterized protein LOC141596627 n=1 Tax=Silene latifolia TaxID=37657 RepID=UPI003D787511